MGLAILKRVQFEHSTVLFEDKEYNSVVSSYIPLSLKKVDMVIVRDLPVYSFPLSVWKNWSLLSDCLSTIGSQSLTIERMVFDSLSGRKYT